ncbi:hypothetical protein ACFLW7_02045 [Chloroflexota bacterium]
MLHYGFAASKDRHENRLRSRYSRKTILRKIPKDAKIYASEVEQLRRSIHSPVAQW